tara:strand:- start:215 stop:1324 length:1110 start_codon:yes stop_codon:yes gene_type:complete
MFILMGSLAVECKFGRKVFAAATSAIGHYPGGLAVGSILGCGAFGAVIGSSLATVITIGKFAIPEMQSNGYSKTMSSGVIAAAGTLGILIPPSLPMIIFAYLTNTSVGRLFAAGIVPGLLSMVIYVAIIRLWVWLYPESAPVRQKAPWSDFFQALYDMWDVALVFICVIGGIIAGIVAPTEGGALGCAVIMILGLLRGSLKVAGILKAFAATAITTSMLYTVVLSVAIFNVFVSETGVPSALGAWIVGLGFSVSGTLILIIISLLLLGCILDVLSIIFIMTPIIFPIVRSLGVDPVWFGIMMIVVIEIGVITPPVGLNIFAMTKVITGVRTRDLFVGVWPFVFADFIRLSLLFLFPIISVWLPNLIYGA